MTGISCSALLILALCLKWARVLKTKIKSQNLFKAQRYLPHLLHFSIFIWLQSVILHPHVMFYLKAKDAVNSFD